MFKYKERQPITLGLLMLVIWSTLAINAISRPAAQEPSAPQMDVLSLMSHAGPLPFDDFVAP